MPGTIESVSSMATVAPSARCVSWASERQAVWRPLRVALGPRRAASPTVTSRRRCFLLRHRGPAPAAADTDFPHSHAISRRNRTSSGTGIHWVTGWEGTSVRMRAGSPHQRGLPFPHFFLLLPSRFLVVAAHIARVTRAPEHRRSPHWHVLVAPDPRRVPSVIRPRAVLPSHPAAPWSEGAA
jgi:hypothetical protein